jgi:hypothetical protein
MADEQVRGALPAGSGKGLPDTNEVEGSAEQLSPEPGSGSRKHAKLGPGPEPDSAAHKRPAKAAHGTPSVSAHSAAHSPHDASGAADAADKRSAVDDDAIWGDRR